MSKGIRRPHLKLKSPFDAKRVIVAACAAVAMLLGATSVGASISNSHEQAPTSAEVSSIIRAASSPRTQSAERGTGLNRRYTIGVRNFLQQQNAPLVTAPDASKNTPKNPLSSVINSTINPALFITQMVEMPGSQAATSSADKSKESGTAPEATPETSATDGSRPTDSSTSSDPPASETSTTPESTPETAPSPTVMDVGTQPTPGE